MTLRYCVLVVALLALPVFAQTPSSVENGTNFSVAGATIYYHVVGSGDAPPLVVVNGGPGFDHNYLHASNVWSDLAKRRRVVFYDQRGNGRSTTEPGAAMDLAAQVDDLEALRAQLKVERIDLMGHSWGGYLVMAYASRHPQRIEHLMIVDSAAPRWSDTRDLFGEMYPDISQVRQRASAAAAAGDKVAEAESIRLYLAMLFYSPATRDVFLSRAAEYRLNSDINRRINQDLARVDLNPELPKFTLPTLVMTGRFDANVAPAIADQIHQAIPGSAFVIFERSGHLPFVEEPDAFANATEEFLSRRR